MESRERTRDAEDDEEDEELGFEDMGLDPRLLRALAKQGLATPTPIQLKAIPLILEGKDVVARAVTGSGKTLAYLLPLVQKILGEAGMGFHEGPAAFVLVPTYDLCPQVYGVLSSLLEHCGGPINAVQLTSTMSTAALRAALSGPPDIVIATPGRIAACMAAKLLLPSVLAKSLRTLVLDEADRLLSFGYEDDLRRLAPHIPRQCQCLLMSATSSAEVDKLKKLVLHNPVTLTLMEAPGSTDGPLVPKTVQQFQIKCKENDKILHLLALLRFELVRKKALFFVNAINTGFRLKLVLEQFGIRTAVLNAELPQNSRFHILQEFNAGVFDYLIATDDGTSTAVQDRQDEKVEEDHVPSSDGPSKGRKRVAPDAEFGVVRGIDFRNVRTVINYDMPADTAGYIHRVGRTGRAGQSGVAITLVGPKDEEMLNDIESALDDGEEVDDKRKQILEYPLLTKAAVESLRYRAEDVARKVTTFAVKEARVKELRIEILNSERLKAHFEDNPKDLELLQHDKVLSKRAPAQHLSTVPEYLQDPAVEAASRSLKLADEAIGQAKQNYTVRKRKRRKVDPLQTFQVDHAKKRRGEIGGAGGATGILGVKRKVGRKGTPAGKSNHSGKKKHKRRKR